MQEGQERELYDYSTRSGRLELDNGAGSSRLEGQLIRLYERALREELRGPLPRQLADAHGLGLENYFLTAKKAARGAASARLRREEGEHGPLSPFGEPGNGPRGAGPAVGEPPGSGDRLRGGRPQHLPRR